MQEILNFLSNEECDEIISMIESNNQRSSVVTGGGNDRSDITDHRTSSTSNLNTNNKTIQKIHKRISEELNIPIEKGESIQGQLYEEGQYFKPHNDFFNGPAYDMHCLSSGNRTHTLMVYLNDDFDGGETNFPNLKQSVKPVKGKAIWWNYLKDGKTLKEYLHEGTPVTKGKKYIITSWWRENTWDGGGDAMKYAELHKEKEETPEVKELTPKTQELPQSESKIIKVGEDVSNVNKLNIPKLTPNGFALQKCPPKLWNLISECYELLKTKEVTENFDGKDHYVPGDTSLLSFDNLPTIKKILHEEFLPIHKEFCGVDIEPSYIYGIRSYQKGSRLEEHVDRLETHHISSIIIVDKDLTCGCASKKYADDWPLDIQGHDGEWYKVYAQPGDMILYESALCKHARKEIFAGNFFRNFYIHYKLNDFTLPSS